MSSLNSGEVPDELLCFDVRSSLEAGVIETSITEKQLKNLEDRGQGAYNLSIFDGFRWRESCVFPDEMGAEKSTGHVQIQAYNTPGEEPKIEITFIARLWCREREKNESVAILKQKSIETLRSISAATLQCAEQIRNSSIDQEVITSKKIPKL